MIRNVKCAPSQGQLFNELRCDFFYFLSRVTTSVTAGFATRVWSFLDTPDTFVSIMDGTNFPAIGAVTSMRLNPTGHSQKED